MKHRITILTGLISLCMMTSCSKEDSNTPGTADITGTYKFISTQAKTNSTSQSVSGSSITKTVTTSDYTTINNAGTITIDANKFVSSNLTYSINSTANSTLYENGVVSGTYSLPFQVTIPASSGTSTYNRITSDSIYFASGSIVMGGTASASQPGGAKIKLENGKLTLTSNVAQSTTTTNQGETVTNNVTAQVITTLQKQ